MNHSRLKAVQVMLFLSVTLLAVGLLPSRALAGTKTWSGAGADANWGTAANWVGGVAPVYGDDLVFPAGAARLANVNTIASETSFRSLTFGASGYSITGNSFKINNAAGITITSAVTSGTITINLSSPYLIIRKTQTWTVPSGVTLDIVRIGYSSSSKKLTKAGAGTLRLSGNSSNSNKGTFTVNGGTVLLAKTSGNAMNSPLVINSGLVQLQNSTGQIPTKRVTVNYPGQLDLNGFNDSVGALTMGGGSIITGTATFTLGGSVTINPSTVPATIAGNFSLGSTSSTARTFTVNNGTAVDDLLISAVVSGGRPIIKAGTGTLTFSGNNSYTTATTINAGTFIVASNNGLGTTGGATTVNSGGALGFRGGITYSTAEAVTINGTGVNGSGALYNVSGNNSFAGAVTLASASTIGSAGGTLTVNGSSSLVNGGFPLTVSGAGDVTVSRVISGTGGLTKNGTGILTLAGANTYSGGTTVNSGTLLVTNATGSATGTGSVTVNSGGSFGGSNTTAVTGTVTINNGGTLTPGTTGSGTLKTSVLLLNATSNLNFDIGTASDQTQVTGNLTLDGVLNVTAAAGFAAGTYTIFTYTGTLTNNTLSFGAMPAGRVYAIDTATAGQVKLIVYPTVASIVRASTDPTNATSVNFTATFNDAVTGVDTADFTLTTTGVTGASVSSVTGSGTTYTVTVNTGSGSGTVRLDITDNNSIVSGGNPLGGPSVGDGNFTTGESYTIDKTPPTVLSINRAGLDPTGDATVDFTVTFSESVTGVDTADFATTTSGVSGAFITGVTGSGTTYTVTVNTGVNSGTIQLDLIDNDTILDLVGNPLGGVGAGNGNFTAGQFYTIDKISPTVTIASTTTNATNVSPIPVTVTFNESVTGFTASDIVTSNGTVSGFAGSGASYSFNLTPSANGLVTADVPANAATDVDGNGNLSTPQFKRTYDSVVPTVTYSNRSGTNPTNAPSVNYTVIFSEAVTGVDATDFTPTVVTGAITGAAVTGVTGSGTTYTVTVNTGSGSGALRLNITDNDSIMDLAGNKLGGTGLGNGNFTTGQFFTIDKTGPIPTISSTTGSFTNLAIIPVTVTFSEPAIGFTLSDITTVNGTATNFAGSGASYSFDLLPDADGVVTVDIAAGTSVDAVGNASVAATQFTRTYDTLTPTADDVYSTVPDGTYGLGATIPIRIAFSEPVNVTGVPTLTLETGTVDAVVDYTSGSGTSELVFNYTVAAGHTASVALDYVSTTALALPGGATIKDLAGNPADITLPTPGAGNPGALADNNTIVINSNTAAVTNVTSTIANGTYGIGVLIPITITFSRVVNVVGTPQLTLQTGSTPNGIANYSSGSGSATLTFNYTVGAGQNSINLDYLDESSLTLPVGSTIKDTGGVDANLLLPEPDDAGSLGFNKTIVIDTTAPTITSITSTTPNGTYGTSTRINITVNFSEPVTLATANLQVTLETGTVDAVIEMTPFGPATTVSATYTVGSGHTSPDLTAISPLTLAAGATLRDAAGNNATLTIPAGQNIADLKAIVINPAAPSKMAFSTSPQTTTAGVVSGTITVQLQNSLNTPTNAITNQLVYLTVSSTGTVTFTPASPLTILAGTNSVSFTYTDTKSGAHTITASDDSPPDGVAGLTDATQVVTINPAAPVKLAFSTLAQTTTAGVVTGTMTIELQDTFNNPVNAGAGGQAVFLTSDSTGTVTFSPSASLTIAAGTSAINFTYTDTKSGSPLITASDASPANGPIGLTDATQTVTVNTGVAAKLIFLSSPETTTAGIATGDMTLQLQDAFNNAVDAGVGGLTIALTTTSTGTITFTPASPITMLSGSSLVDFTYKDTQVGTPTITASATGLTSAVQTVTVNPAKFIFIAAPASSNVNTASGTFTVQLQDTFSNPMNAGAGGQIVHLTTTSTGTVTFTPASPLTIAAGTSTVSFTYTDNTVGNYTITAADTSPATPDTGHTNASTAIAITLPSPIITITKSTSVASAAQGAQTTYTITITNTGLGDATGVTVNDPLPTGFFYATTTSITGTSTRTTTLDPAYGAVSPTWGTWTIPANTGSLTITFRANIGCTTTTGVKNNSPSTSGNNFTTVTFNGAGSTAENVTVTAGPAGTLTVNGTADSDTRDSVLTLREAILLSEGTLAKSSALTLAEWDQAAGCPKSGMLDTIIFNTTVFPPAATATITAGSALPSLTDPAGVVIDAFTAPNLAGVVLDGTALAATIAGLDLASGNNIIRNLTFRNYGTGIALSASASSNNEVSKNLINNPRVTGIMITGGTSHTIKENTVAASSGVGIDSTGSPTSLMIRDNIVSSAGSVGIRLGNTNPTTNTILNNQVTSNIGAGIVVLGGSGNIVDSNTVLNNTGGITLSSSATATVTKNLVGETTGVGITVGAGSTGSKVTINTLRNSTADGILISANTAKVYHNTINGNTGDGIEVGASVTGFDLRNNIVSNNTGGGINAPAGGTINFNDYFNNTGGACINGCAIGANSITSDPLFINPASPTYDFHLKEPSSPAINVGLNLGADQPDVNGSGSGLFNGANPDMGAYESSISGAPGAVTLTVTTSTPSVLAGGSATYTMSITNTGGTAITTVVGTSTLPSGFTFLGGSTATSGNATRSPLTPDPAGGESAPSWGTFSIPATTGSLSITFQAAIACTTAAGVYHTSGAATGSVAIPSYDGATGTLDDVTVTLGDPVIVVNSTGDGDVRNSVITLREAILLANGTLSTQALTTSERSQISGCIGSGIRESINFDGGIFPSATPGTITISGSSLPALTDTAGVLFDGFGKGVIIDGANIGTLIGLTVASNSNYLRNFTVKRFAGTGSDGVGILLSTASTNTIIDVTSRENGTKGFFVSGGSGNQITTSTATLNGGLGMDITGGTTAMTSVTVTSNSGGGIKVATGTGNTINTSTISSNTGIGVELISDSNSLTGSTLATNTTIGVSVSGSSNTVSTNTITNSGTHGISIPGSTNTAISTNTVTGSSQWGLLITGSSNTATGNTINSNGAGGGGGVLIQTGTGNTVTGGTINSNTGPGVRIESDSNTVSSATVSSNTAGGAIVTGNSNNLTSLTLATNTGVGVDITGSTTSLSTSTITSPTSFGVRVVTGTGNTISGTTVDGATGAGVRLESASNSLLTGTVMNTITGPGVLITAGAGNKIDGTIIRSNAAIGVSLTGGTGTVVQYARIAANTGDGVDIAAAATGSQLKVNVINGNTGAGVDIAANTTTLFNNTVSHNTGAGVVIGATVTGFDLRNNMFTNNGGAGINAPAGGTIDYNNTYGNVPSGACVGGCALGANAIKADPRYASPGTLHTSSFALSASSPAINRGLDLVASQPDLNGSSAGNFNATAPDMGAVESTLTTPPVATSAISELLPITVYWNSTGIPFTWESQPTIGASDSGVDRVNLTMPAGYASPAVTGVTVSGTALTLGTTNCTPAFLPEPSEYCVATATSTVTVISGLRIIDTTANKRMTVNFTVTVPTVKDAGLTFVSNVDDQMTASAPVTATAGNVNGVAANGITDNDTLTVTTVDTVMVRNTTDVVNGSTGSAGLLVAAPGTDGISLREALLAVNAGESVGFFDTIDFNASVFPTGAPATIPITSALPSISDAAGTAIIALNRPVTVPVVAPAGVIVDGTSAGAGVAGLTLTTGNNRLLGLTIRNFSGLGISIPSGAGTGNEISGMVIHANGGGGVSLASNSAKLFHNTIQLNTGTGVSINSGVTGLEMRNNLITNNTTGGISATSTVGTIDQNGYFNNGASGNVHCTGGCTIGANSIKADPRYTNAAVFDFSLLASSSAVNRGVDLTTNQPDMNGDTAGNFNATAPDLGARESTLATPLVATSVLSELIPITVYFNSTGIPFTWESQPTISATQSGVDQVVLTIPTGFSAPAVTGVTVSGTALAAGTTNCTTAPNLPDTNEYCTSVSGAVLTVTSGLRVLDTTANKRITVNLTLTVPTAADSGKIFTVSVDDAMTVSASVAATAGNVNGVVANGITDNDTLTVTTVNTVRVSNTTDVINGSTGSAGLLVAAPGTDGISLREALTAVKSGESNGVLDTIDFTATLGTITVSGSALPSVDDATGTIITAVGSTVQLTQSALPADSDGLTLTAGANKVLGMIVRGFPDAGIAITGGTNKLFHNTIQANGTGLLVGAGVTGLNAQNNLITNNTVAGISAAGTVGTIDYTGYFNNGATGNVHCTGGCTIGTNAIKADPRYTNAATFDFTLSAPSPAINRGVDLVADQPDMNGATAGNFDSAAPDLGARESALATPAVATSALSELLPITVYYNSTGIPFTWDSQPTISASQSGVDKLALTLPAGYSIPAVTGVTVSGTALTAGTTNCTTAPNLPDTNEYCTSVSGAVLTVTSGLRVLDTTANKRMTVNLTLTVPTAADSGKTFTVTVDDAMTSSATVAATAGNVNGVAANGVTDNDTLTVTTVSTVRVTNTTDGINGNTGSAGLLVAAPGTDGISLREALTAVKSGESNGILDTIDFTATLGTITVVGSVLPTVSDATGTIITAVGSTVQLTQSGLPAGSDGLTLTAGSNKVLAMIVRGFPDAGVEITGGTNKLFHNTIQANGTGLLVGAGVTGLNAQNNLITNNSAAGISAAGTVGTIDYTGYFNNGSGGNVHCTGGCTIGTNSIKADPRYTNAGTFDFSLTTPSPAINRGLDLTADQPDMNGATAGNFDSTAPDLGARESTLTTPLVATSALSELIPITVYYNSTGVPFTWDSQPTISASQSGVDRLALTLPAGYSIPAVTGMTVSGTSLTAGTTTCSTAPNLPDVGEYCSSVSGSILTVTFGNRILDTTANKRITVNLTLTVPTTADGGKTFTVAVDDAMTSSATVSATAGNVNGTAANGVTDNDTLTVTTVSTVRVTNTTDVINGSTGSVGLLIAAPGADGISLREALTAVKSGESNGVLDTIDFTASLGTITVSGSVLPSVDDATGTIITAVGSTVQLTQSALPAGSDGLMLTAGSNKVLAMIIRGFPDAGIAITGGTNKLFHNTLQANGTGLLVGAGVTGLNAQNNLITNNTAAGISAGGTVGTIDYTGYFNNGASGNIHCTGGCTIGTNSIKADPRYTNPAAFDFTLSAPSPAINRGVDLVADQPDMNGATAGNFDATSPDLGARESTLATPLVATSALSELVPITVYYNSTGVPFTWDSQPTISASQSGVDRVLLTLPTGYASPSVTGMTVSATALAAGTTTCSTAPNLPDVGEYCASVSGSVLTVTFGNRLLDTTANKRITINLTLTVPTTANSGQAFAVSVDDAMTGSATIAATAGNVNGTAANGITDNDTLTVTTVDKVTVRTTNDTTNGNTGSASLLVSYPGTDGISLREALAAVRSGVSFGVLDTIDFLSNLGTITVTGSPLQAIDDSAGTIITGVGSSVQLTQSALPAGSDGLTLTAGANKVLGMIIRGFPDAGIAITGGTNKLFHNSLEANATGLLVGAGVTGLNAQNNLITNNTIAGIDSPAGTGTIDYNGYFNNGAGGNAHCASGCTIGANAIKANPRYTNPGTFDFTLTAPSPAINRGVDLVADQPDMNGATAGNFDSTGPDMGARESTLATSAVATSALSELVPITVYYNSTGIPFTWESEPTISASQSGVDQIALTLPAGYSAPAVTGVTVSGTALTLGGANCSTAPNLPNTGEYCVSFASPVLTITSGLRVLDTTANKRMTVNLTLTVPTTADSGKVFVATVDDAMTSASVVTATAGNVNGTAANGITDNDTLTVTTVNTLRVRTTNDTINGNTGSAGLLVAYPGTDGISLREALTAVNAGASIGVADTIDFNASVFPAATPATITVTGSALPAMGDAAGTTLTALNPLAGVILTQSGLAAGTAGLTLSAGSNRISRLEIRSFPGNGITVSGGSGTIIESSLIRSNGGIGVALSGASHRLLHVTIHGNTGGGISNADATMEVKNSLITNNTAYGISSPATDINYSGFFGNGGGGNCTGGCTLGNASLPLDPVYTSAGTGDFTLQSTSPMINMGVDLGVSQPDQNDGTAGTFNGNFPDFGRYETTTGTTNPSITISKTVSPNPVNGGAPATYVITLTNSGTRGARAVSITDILPAGFTYTSTGVIGGTATRTSTTDPTANSGTPNWAAWFIPGSGGTLTITFTAAATAPQGIYNNTVSATSIDVTITTFVGAPVEVLGYNVSGVVFSDANRNGVPDLAESGIGSVTVQIFAMPGNTLTATQTTDAGGNYLFTGIANGTYEIRETTPANYVATTATILAITINNAHTTGQHFGNFAGAKITGTVFLDTGTGGGTPNNGVKEGAETGINGVSVRVTDVGGGTVYDQTTTTLTGGYTLWVPTTVTISVVVRETNPANYLSTTPDTIALSAAPGGSLANNQFGDVPPLSFSPNGIQTVRPGGIVVYAHTLTAGTAGQITLTTTTSQGFVWTFYKDTNENGQLDNGEPTLTTADLNLTANQTVKILVRAQVGSALAIGIVDSTEITATQVLINSVLTDIRKVIDLTTVGEGSLKLTKTGSVTTAKPGDAIIYTLTYTNISAQTLTAIVVYDRLSEYLLFVSATPALDAGFPSASGVLRWTIPGTLAGGAGGSVSYTVTVK